MAAALAALALVLLTVPSALAVAAWSVTSSRDTVGQPATTTVLTITDLGGSTGADAVGCIEVSIPSAVTVTAQQIASVTSGKHWVSSLARAQAGRHVVDIVFRPHLQMV